MTIDEAIRELNALHEMLKPDTDIRFLNAIKLGIEALKGFKSQRDEQHWRWWVKLLGETEE